MRFDKFTLKAQEVVQTSQQLAERYQVVPLWLEDYCYQYLQPQVQREVAVFYLFLEVESQDEWHRQLRFLLGFY